MDGWMDININVTVIKREYSVCVCVCVSVCVCMWGGCSHISFTLELKNHEASTVNHWW